MISVVIPVRNCERFLGVAIESVLSQSPAPDEVLVVDDGSTDATADIARSYGGTVRHVARRPLGLAATLNHGVELARGDLLAFLDADDLWTQDKLRLQTDALSARPELDAVFGHVVIFGETVAEAPPIAGYGRSAMLVRRVAFDRVGAFGDWPRLGEFIDWYARAVDLGLQTLLLADVVLLRRVHDDNMGVRLRDERSEYTRVLKGILDRRRAADAS